MIGPSSGTGGVSEHEVSDNQSRAGNKRIFEDLDIESFCEEVQNSRKRYQYQEIEAPMEVIASNQVISDATALFSPLSAQEAGEECPVARLEVLLVDELKQEQVIQEIHVEETNYPIGSEYWEPVVTVASSNIQHTKTEVPSSSHQQQQFDDQETGNLSWLLDFKLDPFIEVADEKSTMSSPKDTCNGSKTRINGRSYGSTYINDVKRNYNENGLSHQEINQNYSSLDNRNFASSRCNGPKKPPFTYTELIEHALRERGELTVSAIYQWISEHFPYYKSNDDRWKNSVRHNLSINPHFRKGSKAPHGAGHLWAIANRSADSRPRQTINTSSTNSSIKQICKNAIDAENLRQNISQMSPIDEVEAATASITQQSNEEETESIVNSVTLEHCAEEILSGIKKEVEVQYLVPMMVSNSEHETTQSDQQTQEFRYPVKESDFLNPVSKEVVAEECGLISEGYLVTDLNPTTLGVNMIEPEIITPENLFGEELSFQFYELSSPSQIQSA
ncbi:unnamed protein product [Xylocopa violacea]|uniref:Fork-head domain-containing protein n=1 Tax=Xylocopa violacea TaxID=135666 RepID=A0ABP1NSV4_XYLVO